jgi:hypothetical protein
MRRVVGWSLERHLPSDEISTGSLVNLRPHEIQAQQNRRDINRCVRGVAKAGRNYRGQNGNPDQCNPTGSEYSANEQRHGMTKRQEKYGHVQPWLLLADYTDVSAARMMKPCTTYVA